MHLNILRPAAFVAASVFSLLRLSACDADARAQCQARPRMEVAFVLDTTGSMSGMIAGAKQKIWAIANRLKSAQPTPDIHFGLVGYRDRGDEYVTKVFGLTSDLDEVYAHLHALEAEGGGDEPESVNEALRRAVCDLQWSHDPRVLRVIFLVGDAPPHLDYQDDVPYWKTCQLANRKGILINTLQCGHLNGTEAIWRDIARATHGSYAAILQDGGSVTIETRYDEDIRQLNLQLNNTIILFGSAEEQEKAAMSKSTVASMPAEAVADRSSYLGKAEAGAVITGRGDLIAEVMNGRQQVDSLDVKQLDPKLQAMSAPKRNEFIEKKVAERRVLQSQLAELVAKRDADAARQLKDMGGKDGVLELNAYKVLEGQAKEKGFEFGKP